jgi:hypothetical protein
VWALRHVDAINGDQCRVAVRVIWHINQDMILIMPRDKTGQLPLSTQVLNLFEDLMDMLFMAIVFAIVVILTALPKVKVNVHVVAA